MYKLWWKLFITSFCVSLLASCSAPPPEATPTPEPEFVLTSDIPYTSESTLDVYAPTQAGNYPVVVAFHGANATKLGFKKLGGELVKKGIVLFAANWDSRLPTAQTTEENYLDGWEDAACAIRFARQNASTFKGDPSRIIVLGHSAGGAVGATITLAGDSFNGDCLVTEGSALPDGFVGLDGAYHYIGDGTIENVPEDMVYLVEPFYHIDLVPLREAVKFKLFVGDESDFFIQAAEDLNERLNSAGYSSDLVSFSDLSHMAIVNFPREQIITAIVEMAYDE